MIARTKKVRSIKGAKAVVPTSLVKVSADGEHLKIGAKKWTAVFDEETGLYWPKDHLSSRPHDLAKKAVETISIDGIGCRLPTRRELLTLVDDTRHSPAIDIRFFPDCPSGWFWSSTPWAASPAGFAWFVFFGSGYANCYDRSSYGFVRAVRGGQ